MSIRVKIFSASLLLCGFLFSIFGLRCADIKIEPPPLIHGTYETAVGSKDDSLKLLRLWFFSLQQDQAVITGTAETKDTSGTQTGNVSGFIRENSIFFDVFMPNPANSFSFEGEAIDETDENVPLFEGGIVTGETIHGKFTYRTSPDIPIVLVQTE